MWLAIVAILGSLLGGLCVTIVYFVYWKPCWSPLRSIPMVPRRSMLLGHWPTLLQEPPGMAYYKWLTQFGSFVQAQFHVGSTRLVIGDTVAVKEVGAEERPQRGVKYRSTTPNVDSNFQAKVVQETSFLWKYIEASGGEWASGSGRQGNTTHWKSPGLLPHRSNEPGACTTALTRCSCISVRLSTRFCSPLCEPV